MNRDDPIIQAWVDATNCYLSGAGLPPLRDSAVPALTITEIVGELSKDEQELLREAVASVAFPQDDWNAGASIADNSFCSCGARGYTGLCPTCQSDANGAGR